MLLAMSGGVDSSVAAALLLRDGYEVLGCFMRLGSVGEALDGPACDAPEDAAASAAARPRSPAKAPRALPLRIHHQGCCSINDAADARRVASRLGTPFYVVNFRRDFDRIIEHFVDEYNAGRTPNPCVRCNDWLKFGKLHEYARQVDADFVASGHYAQIARGPGGAAASDLQLRRGVDRDKDQSYVLFGVPRGRLGRMLLPVGGMRKAEVRALARELGLPVFDKPDSQEICFVPDDDYAGLVRRRTPDRVEPGAIVDGTGRVLGEHPGHQHFTVGQRRGLGVAVGTPLYVVQRDAASNRVVVGPREATASAGCRATDVNWLVDPPALGAERRCEAAIRAHGEAVPACVRRRDDGSIDVCFDRPVHAVAPGQAVVLYEGEVVLGGGWITAALP
ncbi:MAG TPA: tRNA 2-thiouridine(34) synthase MnmA [Phycisphaerales bacterium]|nr:tRNA 2-thiouridine(34) synthase MnmA [Phycisphaerales bacterium]HMP38232.1 tRNA 2-thiouridine(34) synthase MnmA [Phycisphaerales bacterium]